VNSRPPKRFAELPIAGGHVESGIHPRRGTCVRQKDIHAATAAAVNMKPSRPK